MKYSFLVILLFSFTTLFSQNLEEAIYVATETFNTNRTSKSYDLLLKKETEFVSNLNTIDEQLAYFFLLINKGHYLDNINKKTQSITAYETAWNNYNQFKLNEITDYDVIEYCLKPLGILYNKIGDFTNAEHIIKQYIYLAEQNKNNSQRIAGAINLAQLYYTAGRFNNAILVIEKALELKNIPLKKQELLESIKANCLLALNKKITSNQTTNPKIKYAEALQKEDYKTALLHLRQVITNLYAQDKFSARDIAKHHVLNAQLHLKLNHKNACALELKNALKILLPNHDNNKLPDILDLYPENTFIDIFDLLGQIQLSNTNALDCYDRSFYVSKLINDQLTSPESKLLHNYKNRNRSEACLDLLYEEYQILKQNTTITKALQYAERYKSAILKETVSKKSLLNLHPKDSLLIKENSLLIKQTELTNQLIKAEFLKQSELVSKLSLSLNKVSTQLKNLKPIIDNKYSTSVNQNSFETLPKKLKKDKATLVQYFYGNNHIYVFTLTHNKSTFNKIKLDRNTTNQIANYIDYFNDANRINNKINTYTTDANKLYKTLLLDKIKSNKNLIIIPDGFLNFIAFESLITQPTNTTNYSNIPFLIKDFNITYNTSVMLYLESSKPKFTNSVLGVFPVFKNSNKELNYSINEAESIDKYTDAKFLMYNDAKMHTTFNEVKDFSILHLSTHANAGTFSTPAYIEFNDKNLYLNEIYSKQLNNQLVVLSACETGIGQLIKGEGSLSLARGFQYAGVNQLLFSLWKVNDLSTSQIMHNFYKTYVKSKSVSIANTQSKIDYLQDKTIVNAKKSPYYWSAFVYYGSPTKHANNTYLKYVLFTLITLSIGLLLWKIIRKKLNGRQA
ncbi:CHAT domain-containing protein [Mesoflavibacter profundi]|uniref:CHAT domain-containing protein n=1 Tax=Mesoflavibacter profundi TaxID=2708110 RepID=A0ABT4S2C7_9FLAO|nr:CHAT domain-containing protein [Mesoflavibacter profundi]MDA0178233.1 CHAT domain-containing protein [Mesoflavibacter profundi]